MSHVHVGKGTVINGKSTLVGSKDSKIFIGKYCAIADGLQILTLNHDPNFPAIQGKFYKNFFNSGHPGELTHPPTLERTKGDVTIGNNVWIGANVYISSGITIGDGAIIGAKSVITKDVEPYSLHCGNPGVFKKYVFDQDKRNFLIELKWWDWSDEKIKKNRGFFFTNLKTSPIQKIKENIIN